MLHLAKDGIFPITKIAKGTARLWITRAGNDSGRGKIKRYTFLVYPVSRV